MIEPGNMGEMRGLLHMPACAATSVRILCQRVAA